MSRVYVEGGWIDPVATIPTEGGIAAVVRFAEECWHRNIALQRQVLELQLSEKGSTDAQV